MQTAHGSIDTAIAAMRADAIDFVVKPTSTRAARSVHASALKIEALQGEISRIKKAPTARSRSPTSSSAVRPCSASWRSAPRRASDVPGADRGRERRRQGGARARHPRRARARASRSSRSTAAPSRAPRRERAVRPREGLVHRRDDERTAFAQADGGTLFLDEIGELPLDVQAKLLRALQEGEMDPSGRREALSRSTPPDHRDQHDLSQMVRKAFREDLFYRWTCSPSRLPPLRERLEDIPVLGLRFLARFAAEEGRTRHAASTPRTRWIMLHALFTGPATCASSRTPCSARSCSATAPS